LLAKAFQLTYTTDPESFQGTDVNMQSTLAILPVTLSPFPEVFSLGTLWAFNIQNII
jgi:hypothetical protein